MCTTVSWVDGQGLVRQLLREITEGTAPLFVTPQGTVLAGQPGAKGRVG